MEKRGVMKRLLVVTHCSPSGLPQQGFIVAERLRDSGVHVKVIGRAASAWGRLAEIVLYSLCLIPRYEVVLVDVFGLRAFAYESPRRRLRRRPSPRCTRREARGVR